MKKNLSTLALILFTCALFAKTDLVPYYTEHRANGWIIYFSGKIEADKMGDVKILQNQYLEGFDHQEKRSYEWQLSKLGIKITVVPDNEHVPSEQTYPYNHPPHHLFHDPQ